MGVWEEQAKQTAQHQRQWAETQNFNFIQALLNATNEEEVKAAYIREFSLPVKTQERHDLLVEKVLFEFKHSVKLRDVEVAAKVIAQAVYYINRIFKKGRINEIDFIVIADKDEARIMRVLEFRPFYESDEYKWDDFRPSSPDPTLIEAITRSKLLESNRVYRVTDQDDLHLFTNRLYKILFPNSSNGIIQANSKRWSLWKSLTIIAGLILVITSGLFIRSQHYQEFPNKFNPTQGEP